MNNITSEIIAIGTEILLGEITDTNSVYISRALRDIGVNVYFMTSVGDNEARIVSALKIAMQRADIIIVCGGLGPTVDDMTRPSIATATERDLVFHQELLDQIEARFAMYRSKMTDNNRRQAYLPQDAILIDNPVGTAPAFMVKYNDKLIISLPGVPREMTFLMQNAVIPHLLREYTLGTIKVRILKTAGIGESSLDELLGDELLNMSNPSIGLAAHHGTIDIRLTAKSESADQADQMLENLAQLVYKRARSFIFGEGDDELDDVLVQALTQKQVNLRVIEAGTSTISEKLAHTNIITHQEKSTFQTPRDLAHAYNINPNESLRDMAQKIIDATQLMPDQAMIIAITLPDVDENSDQDISTVILVAHNGDIRSRVYGFGGRNNLVQDWIARWSFANLWRMLKSIGE